MRFRPQLAIALAFVAGCAGASEAPSAQTPFVAATAAAPVARGAVATATTRQRVQVLSVTDGDTIRVSLDGRSVPVRYIGVDTPETVDPRRPVGCFGLEATAFNQTLVAGKTVELEKDLSETDKYDRLLRYVWVERNGQIVMVNEELVREGYATSSSYPPDVTYQDRFRSLEAQARQSGRGLWGPVCAATPTEGPSPSLARTAAPAVTAVPRTQPPTAAPATPRPTAAARCDASYPTVCIPPPPPDLDCGQIPFRRFVVRPPDPHRFDGDRDGIGCE